MLRIMSYTVFSDTKIGNPIKSKVPFDHIFKKIIIKDFSCQLSLKFHSAKEVAVSDKITL